jgi:ubiquinone/menaquinone biosynthesis C-methylase UbiE
MNERENKRENERKNSPGFPYIAEHIFAPIYSIIAANILKKSGIRERICLDLGCGLASLGIAVAELTEMQIYGIDISREMCQLSRDKACRHTLSAKVAPLQADVHRLPFKDNCADLIVSRGSVFFWKDLPLAFNEVARVLSPGGQAWIGGGFGTKELKKQISEKMTSMDPQWSTDSKKRLSPENFQAMQDAGKKTGIPCNIVRDDSGFWMVLRKEG